jgi:ribosomal protein S18 acetylase RimI-like enzyme
MPIVFRKADADDISKIARLQKKSQSKVEFKDFTSDEQMEYLLSIKELYIVWVNRILSSGAGAYNTYLACDSIDNTIVGFIGYQVFENKGYIRSLYINPNYLRQGIGSKLLAKAFAYFDSREITVVRLEVLENNARAQAFYTAQGFKFVNFYFPKELGGSANAIFSGKYHVLGMERKQIN